MNSKESCWRTLVLKRDGVCAVCHLQLEANTNALWNPSLHQIKCLIHGDSHLENANHEDLAVRPDALPTENLNPNHGSAGGSAKAEGDRRIKKREDRINTRFPKAGKFILALTDVPQSTKAWETGAKGEIAVGKALDDFAAQYHFKVIHDRLIPKSRANIDHIAITHAGILKNNSIDMTVTGVIAFYKADWDLFKFARGQIEIQGVLLNSQGLEPIVSREGKITDEIIEKTVDLLAIKLESAT